MHRIEKKENFCIKNMTSFKIGGNIAKIYFPKNEIECAEILEHIPHISVYGNWSNTLVSSDGFDGEVMSTSKVDNIIVEDTRIIAGAGVKGPMLSKIAMENGLSGLEFMIGFPGSIGGEVYMNASAHGQAISDIVESVTLYSEDEGFFRLSKEEMQFEYRKSICHNNPYIVLGAEFNLKKKPIDEIKAKMEENLSFRKSHQPMMTLGNAGSIFKNPEGDSAGRLLDSCQVKGMRVGGVKVWENHANFIVNDNNGTSLDVLELMLQMYTKVYEKYNIKLEPEVRFLGHNNLREVEICRTLYQK